MPADKDAIIDRLLTPKPLSYYEALVREAPLNVTVSPSFEEQAVILKAHDRGVRELTSREIDVLHFVIADLKHEIENNETPL